MITWYGGGIFCGYDASPTIRNCVITDNFAHFGGGICGGKPTIINCIFTDNEALNGSAISADDSAQIINCTIVGNTGGFGGFEPAVMLWNGGIVTNSILWDNDPNQLWVSGANTVTYSDIQGGWAGTGNIDADPCFVDADANDFHLIGGMSPCFNAGDPNYAAEPNETDIDGDERVIDGRVDMGADEVSDCMNPSAPGYDDWVYWGKPDCWCCSRQCNGDADCKKALLYWVSSNDFTILKSAYNKTDALLQTIPNGICADFDHQKQLLYRVSTGDFDILKEYYGKPEFVIPCCDNNGDCVLEADDKYNFWTN